MPKRKKYPSSLTIRVSIEIRKNLEKVAEAKNQDLSDTIREILEDYLS